ncbi:MULTISPECIES: hypothetical protein [Comamonas]|nr:MULTISPECIES: hypothetical protein [Comamonas]QOQ82540.1 hypothetical protein INP81_00915 [Comamonas thiooxydans]
MEYTRFRPWISTRKSVDIGKKHGFWRFLPGQGLNQGQKQCCAARAKAHKHPKLADLIPSTLVGHSHRAQKSRSKAAAVGLEAWAQKA